MPVVFVLVDALRHDYLSYHQTAPFLSHCAANGVYIEKVEPSLGFCERVEILTGVGFPKNGFFSAIGRNEQHINPYFFLKACPGKWCDNSLFREVLRRGFRRIHVRLQPYEIPFDILPELVLTEDAKSHQAGGAFKVESLVDVFAEAGKKISWNFAALGLHNGSDEDRIRALKKSFGRHEADMYFLYLSPLDSVAHQYGPLSPQTGDALRAVDAQICDLFETMKKVSSSSVLMVLGDHGMADVRQTLDAESVLLAVTQEFGLRQGKDFRYFLDSTDCRIWGKSGRFREVEGRVVERLERSFGSTGYWLNGEWDKALYGEHIWVCTEGVLVFPDFFHRGGSPYKGMHGYAPKGLAMRGLGLIYAEDGRIPSKKIQHGSLGDVANTLCALAGVRPPKDSLGRSWISKDAR